MSSPFSGLVDRHCILGFCVNKLSTDIGLILGCYVIKSGYGNSLFRTPSVKVFFNYRDLHLNLSISYTGFPIGIFSIRMFSCVEDLTVLLLQTPKDSRGIEGQMDSICSRHTKGV